MLGTPLKIQHRQACPVILLRRGLPADTLVAHHTSHNPFSDPSQHPLTRGRAHLFHPAWPFAKAGKPHQLEQPTEAAKVTQKQTRLWYSSTCGLPQKVFQAKVGGKAERDVAYAAGHQCGGCSARVALVMA